ncbi:MAG: ECF transporter S component [Chloroflexi bacterium]|nr:ECF transporter S component [Chloroflexota bacterium]
MIRKIVSGMIYTLCALLGLLAFIYPFLSASGTQAAAAAQPAVAEGQNAPLLTATLVGLSLMALLIEVQGEAISAKTVAMLGVLVAGTSLLRFLEVAIPLPGGFSPIFAPIMLAGFVFGGRFGFLMGSFTVLISALITGGVGPWLPYQMFTAGWVGMTAGWLGLVPLRHKRQGGPHVAFGYRELIVLCLAGFGWGLLYGAIINVYFWPFAAGPAGQSYQAGLGLGEILARYGAFYLATSLGWDMARAIGNVALILFLGAPMVRALARFRRRFYFEVQPNDR